MYYGDEKRREMMRSILPSKAAKSAKEEKRLLNRKLRTRASSALRQIRDEEDWENSNFDFWDDGQEQRQWIISDRRGADKLAHFMRWAEHTAKDIPDGEKMGYIKGLLPGKGIIFDHACGHLEHLDGFSTNEYDGWISYGRRSGRETLNRADLILQLKKVCEVRDFHTYLNDAIRKSHKKTYWTRILRIEEYDYQETRYVEGELVKVGEPEVKTRTHTETRDKTTAPRQLMGMDDVEDFVDDIIYASRCNSLIEKRGYRGDMKDPSVRYSWMNESVITKNNMANNPDYHPEWLNIVKPFIEDFMKGNKSLKNYNILIPQIRKFNKWNPVTGKTELVWKTVMVSRGRLSYDWKL